jgi:hypothetical protein
MTEALAPAPASSSADAATSVPGLRTLRSLIEERSASGRRFHLAEVVSIVVPICTDLAQRHAAGELVFVHASSVGAGPDGVPRYVPELGHVRPTDPADLAAVAPEIVAGGSPTTKSSVFALGAIVYEMLTLVHITPGMKPPSELVSGIPSIVDTILSKALVTDLEQRPDDLPAFAQAIHHFAPNSIAPPPMVDEHAFEVDLDLRLSMIPEPTHEPAPSVPKAPRAPQISASHDPFAAVVDQKRVSAADPLASSRNRSNEELSSLRDRLEADPAPRWIVVKDKMDHGPFAAIELLQQIVSDTFTGDDELVDTHQNARVKIKDHPEFSRFAHHANLRRDQVKETKAVVAAEKREKAAGASKAVIGIIAVAAVVAVAVLVVLKIKGQHDEDERKRLAQDSQSLKGEGSVAAAQKAKPKPGVGGGVGRPGGGGGGTDFESALKNSISDMDADTLSPGECGNPIGTGIALGCGLDGKAWVKVAIQNGRALGVTVTTDPDQPGVNSCIASGVRGISWRSTGGVSTCTRTFKTK